MGWGEVLRSLCGAVLLSSGVLRLQCLLLSLSGRWGGLGALGRGGLAVNSFVSAPKRSLLKASLCTNFGEHNIWVVP